MTHQVRSSVIFCEKVTYEEVNFLDLLLLAFAKISYAALDEKRLRRRHKSMMSKVF